MTPPLTVLGLGLIGGSAALATRAIGRPVQGFDTDPEVVARALDLGLIQQAWAPGRRLEGLVLLAVPPGRIGEAMNLIAPDLAPDAVLTDAASVKGGLASLATRLSHPRRFVPGHPIAGSHRWGPNSATPDLFHDRPVVLCPETDTEAEALATVQAFWESLGARVCCRPATVHDEAMARLSHLPHLAAFALADLQGPDDALAGPGFRDATRLALGRPDLWRDICLANAPALLVQLDAFREGLDHLAEALAAGDSETLDTLFHRARTRRAALEQP